MSSGSGNTFSPEFNSASRGDCILRSSDGVDYKVFQNILSLASPVFETMFDLPQKSNETPGESIELPVISVPETSSTLSLLLPLLYPCRMVTFPNIDAVINVLNAYDKYEMNTRSLHLQLHELLISQKILSGDPLGAYAVAWRLGMKEEVQIASRFLHTLDLNDRIVSKNIVTWSGGLEALSALWDLRLRREELFTTSLN
ncbi:hypothetical protein FRB94_011258 [Tulasnella sp. JGI-2019a]|nr:hypothetical protein FRB94_011258 [Tulasnella sp. JGI-2019a]KAG9024855.1 hypothetical protein FRB95_010968 [Tulasnella sp. JGI-2019a]